MATFRKGQQEVQDWPGSQSSIPRWRWWRQPHRTHWWTDEGTVSPGWKSQQQRGHWRARICQCISWIFDFQEARNLSLGVRLRRRWSPRHVWRRTIRGPQEDRHSRRRSQENPPRKREPWNTSDIHQESVGRRIWRQRRVLLQERQIPEHAITLDAVDIICACRPQVRRIAVMHLSLQNGKKLPRPLIIKFFDAINEYNNSKQREDQRPRWGLHMTEAHVMAIADIPVPPNLIQETEAAAKAKAKAKPAPKQPPRLNATPSSRSTSSTSLVRPPWAETTTDTTTRTRWKRSQKR